jgi:molybdopterin-guanine dinucleotide biosynthesis protein A
MGRPKALIDLDGVLMADRVAAALLAGGCCEAVVVGRSDVLSSLATPVIDDDPPAGLGPISGVLTALRRAGSHAAWVFVVACDLRDLSPAVVRSMIGATGDRAATDDVDVVVAHPGRREPMCALCSTDTLHPVAELVAGGARAVHRVLDELRVRDVAVAAPALHNANTPDDLARHLSG